MVYHYTARRRLLLPASILPVRFEDQRERAEAPPFQPLRRTQVAQPHARRPPTAARPPCKPTAQDGQHVACGGGGLSSLGKQRLTKEDGAAKR